MDDGVGRYFEINESPDAPAAIEAPPLEQLIAARQPAPPLVFIKGSAIHAAHMRAGKQKKRLASETDFYKSRGKQSEAELSIVKCHFPKVARACGLKVQKRDIGTELTLDRCSTLMRLGFDPNYSGGVGATSPNRLRAFLQSMHGKLQEQGILKLLWECSLFRAQNDAHQIVLGFDFESDRRSI